MPTDLDEIELAAENNHLAIGYILQRAGLVSSTSEARRMITQGAIRIDGERVEDIQLTVPIGESHLYQVGKRRFAKVRVVEWLSK